MSNPQRGSGCFDFHGKYGHVFQTNSGSPPSNPVPCHPLTLCLTRFQRRDAEPMPYMCFDFCQLIWGTLVGNSEPVFGTTQLGRWRPSTWSESKFGVFPMYLWSEHPRLFFFSLPKDDLFCWDAISENNQRATLQAPSPFAKDAYSRVEYRQPSRTVGIHSGSHPLSPPLS